MLENTEVAIKKGQSGETGNIWLQDEDKQNKNTTHCVLDATLHK